MRSSHFRTGKWSQSSNGDSPLHPVPFLQQRVAPLLPTDPAAPCNRARVQGKKKKNHSDKSGGCTWETSGSATFILRTRWAHILQETTSKYFGIRKVCLVLCTCPVRLLNLQAPGAEEREHVDAQSVFGRCWVRHGGTAGRTRAG